MVSFVFCLWALLTTAIAVVWSVSLLHPVWVLHPDNVHSFGLQKYCVMDLRGTTGGSRGEALHRACLPYGRELRIGNIPSDTWRAAFLLFSSGTLLFIASVLSGLLSVVIQGKWDRYVSMTTKYIQITAGKDWNKSSIEMWSTCLRTCCLFWSLIECCAFIYLTRCIQDSVLVENVHECSSNVKDKQNGHRPDTESCHNTEDWVCKMEIKEKRERTCCRKRFSNFCKINKQPRISVNARVFCLKKRDAIEPGMKLFIVPSFFFFTSLEDMTNGRFSRRNQKCDSP